MTSLPRQLSSLLTICAILSLDSRALYGQSEIGGVVVSDIGGPIPGAFVEAWLAGRRIGWAEADGVGRFHLSLPTGDDSAVIAARAVGFRPASLLLRTSASVQILLSPLPLSLLEMSASVKSDCPVKNDPGALGAWRRVATGGAESRGALEATYQAYDDLVLLPDLGLPHKAPTGEGRFGITELWRRQYEGIIRTKGYGWPSLELGSSEWVYPALESSMVEVFFSREFAMGHTFSWKSGESSALVFCSRKRSRPYIDGVVALDPDGTLLSIQWFFHGGQTLTPAGGGAAFLASDAAIGERRFPSVGISWQQLRDGSFLQRTFQYSRWLVDNK